MVPRLLTYRLRFVRPWHRLRVCSLRPARATVRVWWAQSVGDGGRAERHDIFWPAAVCWDDRLLISPNTATQSCLIAYLWELRWSPVCRLGSSSSRHGPTSLHRACLSALSALKRCILSVFLLLCLGFFLEFGGMPSPEYDWMLAEPQPSGIAEDV